jgi:GNAT superfamily N-acetyltransferase
MDPAEILARFDAEFRADPPTEFGVTRTWADSVLRTEGAYAFIGWWTFGADETAAAVAREAAHFAEGGVQWKVYGHDGPANLADELARAGFEPDDVETFLVLDTETATPPLDPPRGVEVREVTDRAGIEALVAVSNAAFGREEPWRADQLAGRLADPTQALFVAFLDGEPVSSGRLELAPGKAFAGLYGGGTVPAYQRRGVYRALVAARVAEARRRGHRFLAVDARETSRPILERLGFRPLDTVRDWVLPAAPGPRSP